MSAIAQISTKLDKNRKLIYFLYGLTLFTSVIVYSPYFVVVFGVATIMMINIKRYFDNTVLLLFLFSFSYVLITILFGRIQSGALSIGYLIAPISFYCFGRYVVIQEKEDDKLINFWLISFLLYEMILFIYTYIDYQKYGLVNVQRIFDSVAFLTTDAATGFGLMASFGLSGMAVFFSIPKKFKSIKAILFFIVGFLSLFVSVHLVNRSGLFVVLGCFVMEGLYLSRKSKGNLFVLIIIGILAYYIFYIQGMLDADIVEAYEERGFDDESMSTAGLRTYRWITAIQNLLLYPYGWIDEIGTGNAHNMWLDIARWAGIFPFIISVILTISNFKYAIKLFMILKNNVVVSIILCLNVSFLLSCFVEPVLTGMPTLFYLYCMLWGFQKQYYLQFKQQKMLL